MRRIVGNYNNIICLTCLIHTTCIPFIKLLSVGLKLKPLSCISSTTPDVMFSEHWKVLLQNIFTVLCGLIKKLLFELCALQLRHQRICCVITTGCLLWFVLLYFKAKFYIMMRHFIELLYSLLKIKPIHFIASSIIQLNFIVHEFQRFIYIKLLLISMKLSEKRYCLYLIVLFTA